MKKWITCILHKAELPGVHTGPHNSPWKPSAQLEACWPSWWPQGRSYGADKQNKHQLIVKNHGTLIGFLNPSDKENNFNK